jgi:hypothetical protein
LRQHEETVQLLFWLGTWQAGCIFHSRQVHVRLPRTSRSDLSFTAVQWESVVPAQAMHGLGQIDRVRVCIPHAAHTRLPCRWLAVYLSAKPVARTRTGSRSCVSTSSTLGLRERRTGAGAFTPVESALDGERRQSLLKNSSRVRA